VNRNVTVPLGRSCGINASCTAAQNDQASRYHCATKIAVWDHARVLRVP
jgi:hypothetical protein